MDDFPWISHLNLIQPPFLAAACEESNRAPTSRANSPVLAGYSFGPHPHPQQQLIIDLFKYYFKKTR